MFKKIVLIILAVFISSCASDDLIIDGRVSVVGNEPFAYLAITEYKTNKQYKISQKYVSKLNIYQNQNISIKAKIVEKTKNSYPVEIDVLKINK